MNRTIRFERRITVEEADESRIRVSRDLLPTLEELGDELSVRIGDATFAASLVSELCQCAGPSRPHCHSFLILRGDPGLRVAQRLWVEVAEPG